MLARPRLCCGGQKGVSLQVWDPLMAGDTCWGLLGVCGSDCQGETAKGEVAPSPASLLGGPELAPWCCRAPCPFCKQPLSLGRCARPPHVPHPWGVSRAWRCCWLSRWPTELSESPAAEEELVMEPSCF